MIWGPNLTPSPPATAPQFNPCVQPLHSTPAFNPCVALHPQSKRASELQRDMNAWEENRMMTSGVVRLREVSRGR